jgi:hypothetical protein
MRFGTAPETDKSPTIPTSPISLGRRLEPLGVARTNRQRRVLRPQRGGDRFAETARGAGDQRAFTLQSKIHIRSRFCPPKNFPRTR